MSRYKGPKCRLCRREGEKLYLKGARCNSEKCSFNKRNYAPGQHGNARIKISDYGKQLREKQKAKRVYGILERQFKTYVDKALKTRGVTSEVLLKYLESRLDNLVFRSGLAMSRAQARQMIRSGFFEVNGLATNIPSRQIKVGEIIKPINFEKVHLREGFVLPLWIDANVKEKYVKLTGLPKLTDNIENINIQLIIEYYSR
ncbi:hypothetical protein A2V49_04040 [candidate division WWE3 bacterium RBG_19FT_COMBO_34_6]|uniref:Small ribosomal subunit protein uS4 n=1 Tax=candidate division WWE3 bacterium RBG_19FT_COMBO_34_6 TaxID=1802612 RepID=A0A1F4UNJ5_UNCKA|nr:MAG: hypothetical protein A2V49_04040 [candidate division WWE3 bacterium RBG_19FT_COMBO_34_6]